MAPAAGGAGYEHPPSGSSENRLLVHRLGAPKQPLTRENVARSTTAWA
jgi:hypothetical protein